MFSENFGGSECSLSDAELVEQRLLEEDLSLQLQLLQKDLNPPSTLFPDFEDAEIIEKEQELMLPKKVLPASPLMEETNLEALAFCAVLAFALMVPNVFG